MCVNITTNNSGGGKQFRTRDCVNACDETAKSAACAGESKTFAPCNTHLCNR